MLRVWCPVPECKDIKSAGGVGVWAREFPPELARRGVKVTIVMPAHGGTVPAAVSATPLPVFTIPFRGAQEQVRVHRGRLPVSEEIEVLLLENETYFGFHDVYTSDAIPFATDARKYSFLGKAVLKLVAASDPDIVHGSDWMAGYLFGFMEFENLKADAKGQERPFRQHRILTVHNAEYQGQTWKPRLVEEDFHDLAAHQTIGPLFDDPRPEYECVNPLRLAMELADQVNCVSPNNALEITQPPDPSRFFLGGAGLEKVAQRLMAAGRLRGILNGYEYP